ncbi:MAG TPA: pentapeptide repeat-containing protein, partial [Nannocystis sp.]
FMQVERMTEQNQLIVAQTRLTEEQLRFEKERQAVEISLSIADRRQATAREIYAAITADPGRGETHGRKNLSRSTSLLISSTIAQLQPYRSVDPITGKVADDAPVKSPEQEQILAYLSGMHIHVAELDLSRAFLDHADLHGVDLPEIQLPGVRLRAAALYDANFSGGNFALADLTAAQLSRAELSRANFTDAKLVDAVLVDAVLSEANLVRADLTRASLKKAVLKQAQLGSAKLHGVDFSHCDLGSADLTDADLALADLSAVDRAPLVPKVRAAASWWLAVYSDDYAAKLGVSPEQNARNREALARLRAATTPDAVAAVIAEAKATAPKAPG